MPRTTQSPNRRAAPPSPGHQTGEVVDPRWLLKAVTVVLLAALVCGYLTLCLLFYVGQWQIVLHPQRPGTSQPPVANAAAEFVRFAPDDSATPQLTGWWIPATPSAASASRYAQTTLLYLPGGSGSLADASASLTALHSLGINLFAIDYRGYGQSASTHPSQKGMTEDAESAWRYLHSSRGLAEPQIVPYGAGVGASLAAHLASAHPQIPILILDSPQADLLETLRHDPRTGLLPARLLFHENFPLSHPLSTLRTPKLLLSGDQPSAAFKTAAAPKFAVEFNAAPGKLSSQPGFLPSISLFLDQYLPPASRPQLIPAPAKEQP